MSKTNKNKVDVCPRTVPDPHDRTSKPQNKKGNPAHAKKSTSNGPPHASKQCSSIAKTTLIISVQDCHNVAIRLIIGCQLCRLPAKNKNNTLVLYHTTPLNAIILYYIAVYSDTSLYDVSP